MTAHNLYVLPIALSIVGTTLVTLALVGICVCFIGVFHGLLLPVGLLGVALGAVAVLNGIILIGIAITRRTRARQLQAVGHETLKLRIQLP
jgi:hypothetical protein